MSQLPAANCAEISDAQLEANRANAQLSTGPRTPEGKAISCQNNFRHGFCGQFSVLESEDQQEFDSLLTSLRLEHQPATATENILVDRLAQHFWLGQRAQLLQTMTFANPDLPTAQAEHSFALYLRYQTANDRAFSKCLHDLLKLKSEKRKIEAALEQQQRTAAEAVRKQESHRARVRMVNARAAHQELETDIKATIEAPLPGRTGIPFETLKHVVSNAIQEASRELAKTA
jgi:hypothetical protein